MTRSAPRPIPGGTSYTPIQQTAQLKFRNLKSFHSYRLGFSFGGVVRTDQQRVAFPSRDRTTKCRAPRYLEQDAEGGVQKFGAGEVLVTRKEVTLAGIHEAMKQGEARMWNCDGVRHSGVLAELEGPPLVAF